MSAPPRTKLRVRASTACTACRVRRTKCIIPPGQEACDRCRRSGLHCVSLDDDKRKRPTPKANTANLAKRVELLESLLSQQARKPAYDSVSHQESDSSLKLQQQSQDLGQICQGPISREDSGHNSCERSEDGSPGNANSAVAEPQSPGSVGGGLRYIGRLARPSMLNSLTLSDNLGGYKEQKERSQKIIQEIPQVTKDHLMHAFWSQYNDILHLVHRKSFYNDGERREGPSYNAFLHICMMAMGCKFSDTAMLGILDTESQLQREAKAIADSGLGTQREIANVQALLILSDMELARGRDNTGWMYGDMACQLCFDLGLNSEHIQPSFLERAPQTRLLALSACVVHDRYWAVFSGQLPHIASSKSAISSLGTRLENFGDFRSLGLESSFEMHIYRRLLTLMDLTGEIDEIVSKNLAQTDLASYLEIARLDREMNEWYTSLPQMLEWTPSNVQVAPLSFFFLHQQYHSTLLLLHRSWASNARLGQTVLVEAEGDTPPLLELSQSVCFRNAVRMARIFKQYRQRFGIGQAIFTGTQQAGPAMIAILAGIPRINDSGEREQTLADLHCLVEVLQVISKTNLAAERLLVVVKRQLEDYGLNPVGLADHVALTNSRSSPAHIYNVGAANLVHPGPD